MTKPIYLDYAAATPIDSKVLIAMQPYFTKLFYNPSSVYIPARQVRQAYEAARASVAKSLAAKPSEIIFTAGATESINLAIQGVARAFPKGQILISAGEHEAVAAAAGKLKTIPLLPSGSVDLTALGKLITSQTVLASVMQANNEVGTIQPLAKVSAIIKNVREERAKCGNKLPLYLHSDASQAANYLELKVNRLGVDLLTLNGGKTYGPKQSGCLYVKSGTVLEPLVLGGGQERGLRSGTENVAAAIGLARALELAQSLRAKESQRLAKLRDQLISGLLKLDKVNLNGEQKNRLPNNINISIDGVNGETLVHYLDHAGILVATGAACSANKDKVSPTLLAIGLSKNQANSSLRLTLGRQTTAAEVTKAAKIVTKTIQHLRSRS